VIFSTETGEDRNQQLTIHSNLTLILEIALVGNYDDWELVHVLDPENLLVKRADFLKRGAGRNGVHEEEPLARTHILLSHCAVGENGDLRECEHAR
jgi:hypothetical protein